jgi:hypothetical protein
MTYTLSMDLGDLIVMGGVLLSIIGSAFGAKKKKAALAKKAGGPPFSTGSAVPPRATPRTAMPRSQVSPPQPVKLRRVESTPARTLAEAPPSSFPAPPARSRAVTKWSWRQAIIAQTVLGPPRSLKGWDRA